MYYAQRSKTLNERKKDHNTFWHYSNSHNAKCRVVAVLKQPQHVVALEKQPQCEMSCYGCFKTTTTRCGIRETATMRTFALRLFLNNHNALWHVKICHDAEVVSWLLKEMTRTSSDFTKIPQNVVVFSLSKTSPCEAMFGMAQRMRLGDSPLTEDMYSSIETEELEQLFNAAMNNGRKKEDKEEANQQDRKDEDENQTNDISEETVEKKDNKKVYCMICEESSGAHKCSVCDQFVHAICGCYSEDSEGFGLTVT